MKRHFFLNYLIVFFVFVTSANSQMKDGLAFIDVKKNYPEKELILTDIADVSYVHLSTIDDDFLYKGTISFVTENTIVVNDFSSGSILFFSLDGNPKARFNHKGNGPADYNGRPVLYEESKDEIYVLTSFPNHIQVYSSKGEYKRKLTFPQGALVQQVVSYDDKSLLVYDGSKSLKKLQPVKTPDSFSNENDSSLFIISKSDGKVLDYIALPNNNKVSLTFESGTGMFMIFPTLITKCPEGFLLCHPETDMVFLYNSNKSLSPFMRKTPLVSDLDPIIYLDNCMDIGKYQFMRTESLLPKEGSPLPQNFYFRDEKTGEVFRQKITLPDYIGKEFFISPTMYADEKKYHFELELIELKQAFKENKLKGKLKELVATLNEDEDNNVFILVDFH